MGDPCNTNTGFCNRSVFSYAKKYYCKLEEERENDKDDRNHIGISK